GASFAAAPWLKKAVLAQHPAARVAVAPNRISPEMEKLAIAALEQERPPQDRDVVRLGYFSGTRTHQDDFDQCVTALATVMERFPQVHLRVVGHLTVPESLMAPFGDRIETLPIVPWQELPKLYRAVDINLAPLNPDVPFTAGKSELKFVEAGIMGVPTVASQWGPYGQAIKSGRTGWLCATEADWVEGLTQLIQTPDLRQRLGEAAQAAVRDRYLTRTALVDSGQAWGQILAGMPVPAAARSLTVAVVVWSGVELEETPDRWSDWEDGIRALVVALGHQGHDVTVYLQGDPALSHPTLEHRKGVWNQYLSGIVATVDFLEHRRHRPVEADVAIATDWQTAYGVANLGTVRFRMHWMAADPTATATLGDPQREAKMASVFLPLRPVAIGEDLAAQLLTISGFRNALEAVPQPLATAFIESDPQPERHLMTDSLISVLWFDDPAMDPAVRAWVLDTLESLQKAYGSAILVQCYGRPVAEVPQGASLDSNASSNSNSNSSPDLTPDSMDSMDPMAQAGLSRHRGIQHLGLLDNAEERAQRFNGAAAIHGAIAYSPRQNTVEAIACGCAALVMGEDASEDPRHASVPYQRSPLGADALYNHLKQLIDEPQRRCDLTKLGAKWAKQFTWERTADATVQVLERLTFLGDRPLGTSEDGPPSMEASAATPAEVAN
ncbi:MAG: glycosyltransferase, partial [Cyanobacteria bacterium P01_H01_bin.130]